MISLFPIFEAFKVLRDRCRNRNDVLQRVDISGHVTAIFCVLKGSYSSSRLSGNSMEVRSEILSEEASPCVVEEILHISDFLVKINLTYVWRSVFGRIPCGRKEGGSH
jgi:hypothetical protein